MYEYDPWRSFCFNTTTLAPIGVEFWEDDDEWEQVNWYMKVAKCNNETSSITCKPIEEIDSYINNMFITRKVVQPMIDIEYMDIHKGDVLPFQIG